MQWSLRVAASSGFLDPAWLAKTLRKALRANNKLSALQNINYCFGFNLIISSGQLTHSLQHSWLRSADSAAYVDSTPSSPTYPQPPQTQIGGFWVERQ